MKNLLYKLFLGSILFKSALLLYGQVPGPLVINFDDGSNPFSAGAISSDQTISGTNSLYLGAGDFGMFDIPSEYRGQNLRITIRIFDQGFWINREITGYPGNSYGARWGVGSNPFQGDTYLAAALTERSFLSSSGYSTHRATGQNFNSGPWYTVYGYAGSAELRAPILGDGGSNSNGFWAAPTPGPGMWTEWTFTVLANGDATFGITGLPLVPGSDGPLYNIGGEATGIYLYGGGTNSDGFGSLCGVYVDDITIDIAPDDIVPPSVPEGLAHVNVTDNSVDLEWDPSTDDTGVVGYHVYTNGENPISVSEPSATVTGLLPDTTYQFSVSAYDDTGNESSQGGALEVTTQLPVALAIDFDDTVNPFSGGSLSTDFALTGDSALYLGIQETGILEIPAELTGQELIINLKVLDLGLWVNNAIDGSPENAFGPRWGVGTGDSAASFVAATLVHTSVLPSNSGYGVHQVGDGDDFSSLSWESVSLLSGSNRAVLSDNGGTNDGVWSPGTPASEPVWTDWIFHIKPDGDLTLTLMGTDPLTGNNIGGAASQVLLYGGSQDALTGLYVDNITFRIVPQDTEAPGKVTGLTVSNLTDTGMELSWDPSTDNEGVIGYSVISSPDLGEIIVTETGVILIDLNSETEYSFTVVAFDEAGNVSEGSEPLAVTTKETVPPYDGPEYFVDPENGSMDSGNGSAERPWSTLQAVFEAGKTFEPGDIIYLMDGLHGEPEIDGMNADVVSIMPADGAAPTMIRVRFSDTSSNWHLSGVEVSPSFAEFFERGTIVAIRGSHNAFTDSLVYSFADISDWGLLEWTSRSCGGVGILGPDCLLENCSIRNVYHGIAAESTAVRTVVRGNSVENFGGDAMRGLGDDQVFEYNYAAECYNIDDNHDDGFQSWSNGPLGVGTETVYRVTLRGNIIVETTDFERDFLGSLQGIGCFDGMFEDWLIENNVVINSAPHGINFAGAVNCRFLNNTVTDNNSNHSRPWLRVSNHKNGTPPSGNLVRNNLVSVLDLWEDSTVIADHNLIVKADAYDIYYRDHPFDLRLADGNAAIDAGSNEGISLLDVLGRTRRFDGDWDGVAVTDIGAYELDDPEWINHPELGWINVLYASDPDNMWIYSLYLNGWMWTSGDFFPAGYDFNNSRYVYYFILEDVGAWVFDYSTWQWTLNP